MVNGKHLIIKQRKMNLRLFQSKFYFILLLTFSVLSMASCDKDDSDPLRIVDAGLEDLVWTIYYPNDNLACITIGGGERPYSVSCESDILKVNMDKWPNAFNYEILGVGDAEVKISDATGEFIILKVKINYRSETIRIAMAEAYVTGDQMTIAAQKELKEKALTTTPVKAGGGYKFVYTGEMSGIAYVYPDQFGGEHKEGTFLRSRIESEQFSSPVYEIELDGEKRIFILQRYYPSPKSSDVIMPVGLYEDLLEQYQDEYPELEKVYTVQVISFR